MRGRALKMLEQTFSDIYTKFKIHFYQEMFHLTNAREMSLTSTETFCVEVIHALNKPTVNEFANFIQVSSPNAAYKVNSLIRKGYIKKVQSEQDKREFHLCVTDKYYEYFSTEEIKQFEHMLGEISDKLMPEVQIPALDLAKAKTSPTKTQEA